MILVVEDDAPVRNLMSTTLKTHDYKYLTAPTGRDAIMMASSHNPDVVFLDLGLPDMDGIEVIRQIRSWSNMPIIVISARSEDDDKITALDAGADDYLTKPFSVEELLARLRVTIRRLSMMKTDSNNDSSVYTNGILKIDYPAGCAFLNGEELKLTPIEFKLLCLLAKNTGKVLTHTYITQNIWGRSWDNDIASLRVFMVTLRKKLEPTAGSPEFIQTPVGIGYRLLRIELFIKKNSGGDCSPPLGSLCDNQIIIHEFHCRVSNVAHPLHPQHLILCFERLRDAFPLGPLFCQQEHQLRCLLVDVGKVGVQRTAG